MKKQLFSIGFIFATLTVIAQQRDKRLSGLDTIINRLLKEWQVPGISIAVVEKNKVLFTGGFGYKNWEEKKPVTENTLFAIGSCTKAFTAALLNRLLNEDKIQLDNPITDYLPDLKFYSHELTANITVRDVLCHRTGLPRHEFAWYSGAFKNRHTMLHAMRYMEPSKPLRQNFQYNNYMYAIIAALAEKMYGQSWEQLIKEQLFLPAGMLQSTAASQDFKAETDFAYGYASKQGKLKCLKFLDSNMLAMAPAGGINSSAKDMAKWLLLWTNKGKLNGKEIITTNYYRQAISSQMIVSPNLPSAQVPDYYFFNYGLGWYVASYGNRYGIGHGGNINGFSSFMSVFPADSIGVFVAVNQNNSALPRIVNNIIADKLAALPYRDWNSLLKTPAAPATTVGENKKPAAKPSHALAAFCGTYKNEAYGSITITAQEDGLLANFNRWKLNLKHLHNNYFLLLDNDGVFDESEAAKGQFMIDENGEVAALHIPFETEVKDIVFIKQPQAQQVNEDVKQFCGDYDFNGMTVKIYQGDNGMLKASVPGQPDYELLYAKKDEYNIKGAKGVSIKFERDDNGNVPACVFTQPNGRFKVTKINNKAITDGAAKNEHKPSAVATEKFFKYVGEYKLGGQPVKIFTKENVLTASLPGQPEYALELVKGNEFGIKGVKGYQVLFDTNSNGVVIGFTLIQPGGKMMATKNIQ